MRQFRFLVPLLVSLSASTPLFSQADKKTESRCIRLDGKDDYVDFGNIYKDLKLPFTISVWTKLDPSNFFLAPVFNSRNCVSTYSGFWLLVDRNYVAIQYGDGFGSKHHAYRRGKEVTVNLPAGKWHHITAVVKDHTNMELYVDGVNVGGEMTGSSTYPMDSDTPTGLASAGYFVSNDIVYRFKGSLDDIRIWNRALTPEEVSTSMCSILTGKERGLIGYWTFEETSGKTCFDKSSNNFHGTLVGAPERVDSPLPCAKAGSKESTQPKSGDGNR